jgi:outer membrane receptor protein involved in Fe transport
MLALRSGVISAITALVLTASSLFAQSTTGSFQGTITDSSSAALPGVTVTIINPGTNLVRTTVTNQSGNYDAPLLPPGQYNVSAELTGFRKVEKTGLVLQVNQNARVDFTLELSAIEESVQVTAQAPLVDTQDSSVRQVVAGTQVVALPLNGRNFRDLGLIVPGVQDMAQNSNLASRGGGINIVGAQDFNNNFLIDGFDNNDPTTGEIQTFPSVESVQEFTILGASYGADVGFASGGVVSLVSKSGASKFRGNVFEFVRDDTFDEKNYFALTKAPLNRNQFGGTFGGPAGLHNVFFFGSYERLRHREGFTLTGVVPTDAMKRGDFSALSAQLRDPVTGAAFAGNQIPASRFNSIGSSILNRLFPSPNATGSRNYNANADISDDLHVGSFRVDWNKSEKNAMFGRFQNYWDTKIDPSTATFPNSFTTIVKHNFNVGFEWTHVYNAQTVQEMRAGYGHVDNEKWPTDRTDWGRELGIPGTLDAVSPEFLTMGPPSVSVTGYSGITPFTNPFIRLHDLGQVAYTLITNRNDHAIKSGFEYRKFAMDIRDSNTPEGIFTFTGRYTGDAAADLLLGYPSQTRNLIGPQTSTERSWQLAGYVQDDWRASRRLTLNYGLRYEYQAPDTEVHNEWGTFVPALGQAVQVGTNGVPNGIRDNYYKNFAPRAGIVFDQSGTGSRVLRGNYGIYYESLIHNIFSPNGFITAPIARAGQFNASATTPNISLSDPFPASLANSVLAASGVDPGYHGGRVQRWSAGVQQAIGSNGMFDVTYVGSRSTGLASQYNLNQPEPGSTAIQPRRPYPTYSGITWTDASGYARYNALLSKFQRRLSKGLELLASYTLSKTIDNTQDGVPNQDPLNRAADEGRASFDRRHRFVLSTSYLLPFENAVAKDWQVSAIFTATSGMPLTAVLNGDRANVGTTNAQRPNINGDPNENAPHTPDQWFNTSVFSLPAAFTYGNAGRSIINGPGFQTVNLAISRRIGLSASRAIDLRFEAFNLFNHANFLLPNNQADSTQFGKIFSASDPRQLQLGVKFFF